MSNRQFTIFLDYLKILIRNPAVVGFEQPFFYLLQRELEELNVEVNRYQGLLVASKKTLSEKRQKSEYFISVHIDRHGLICTGQNEFQYAAFIPQNRSEMSGDSVSEQTYEKIADRFEGATVMAYQPWYGTYEGKGTIKSSFICPRRNNLVFEIEGLEHVSPGIPVAYSDRLSIYEDRLAAQLDNVLSVAIVLYLYANGYEGTAFFTAQEEVGRSWRFIVDWFRRHDLSTQNLLVLDTSPYATFEDVCKQDLVLRRKDANGSFNTSLVDSIEKVCIKNDIAYTFKDKFIEEKNAKTKDKTAHQTLGRTELGRVIKATEGRLNGATVQVPTTGYHTDEETATIDSVKAILKLLSKLV